jgi:hypothetical protein
LPAHNRWTARDVGRKERPRLAHYIFAFSRGAKPSASAKLEAIEADARAKGWPPELLWNRNFWDCPRGLAAVLDPGDEITEVAVDHITILKVKRDLLNFRRHAA